MKTEYKYITYRPDKQLYTISIKKNGKLHSKAAKNIDKAIEIREDMMSELGMYIEENVQVGIMPDKFKITFSEAWDIFFETDVKPRTEYSTQTHYYRDKMRIIPYVADSKLCRIREETWVRIIEDWHRKGKAGQKCALSGLGRIRMLYRFWGLELDWNKVRPKLDRPVKKVKVDADGKIFM